MEDTRCSGCGKPLSSNEVLYTPDARVVCLACSDKVVMAAGGGSSPTWMMLAGVGAAIGAVPLFVHVSSSSSSSVNGHVTAFVYRDWIAVGAGLVAIVLGLAAAVSGRRTLMRMQAIAAGLAVALFGAYQIASGLGVFAAPADRGDAFEQVDLSETHATPVAAPVAPVAAPITPATCADKDACFELGRAREDAKDMPAAVIAYGRACERGAAGGCYNAGLLAMQATPPDPATAAPWYQKGCDLLDSDACNNLGSLYRSGTGVTKDLARTQALFTTACDHDNAFGCTNLASMLTDGEGVPANLPRAYELYTKACKMDESAEHANACTHAGVAAMQGDGTKVDVALATQLFSTACDREPSQCFNLGVVHGDGLGMKKDPVGARALYRKACDAGSSNACNNLGDMENKGVGGPVDKADAKLLFQKVCDAGDEMGCDNLKKLK